MKRACVLSQSCLCAYVCFCLRLYWTSSAVWLKRVMNWAARSTTTSSLRNSTETKRQSDFTVVICSAIFFFLSHRGLYLCKCFFKASHHCKRSGFLAACVYLQEERKRKWSKVGGTDQGDNQQQKAALRQSWTFQVWRGTWRVYTAAAINRGGLWAHCGASCTKACIWLKKKGGRVTGQQRGLRREAEDGENWPRQIKSSAIE